MGIAGLYEILSPAEKKYSLDDLALGHIDRYNCNLRVAIDVSIWNFQAQSSQGGKNAALRTIFYRCCKLYNLGIKAVFVFDGDQRPSYKRKRNINTNLVNTTEHHLLIAMLKLFKFMVWQASGEAEAECAVLQRLGYVDLVITTDIDVFLFGAQRVLRNFPMSSNEPAICMDSEWIKNTTMLDRSDLILMGLISGSDYFSGVNQVGIQLACSLARSKHHIKFMDALLDQTKNNTRDFLNDSNENDEEGEKINND
ncbi:PIN domain-like protein, partial [Cunninghamella echinulata]